MTNPDLLTWKYVCKKSPILVHLSENQKQELTGLFGEENLIKYEKLIKDLIEAAESKWIQISIEYASKWVWYICIYDTKNTIWIKTSYTFDWNNIIINTSIWNKCICYNNNNLSEIIEILTRSYTVVEHLWTRQKANFIEVFGEEKLERYKGLIRNLIDSASQMYLKLVIDYIEKWWWYIYIMWESSLFTYTFDWENLIIGFPNKKFIYDWSNSDELLKEILNGWNKSCKFIY